ncbi:winged helix-turn-helix transcriptional regulator [Haloarchaeobius amylolyticus]|uniref:winged helix-turn-helix transcriptional regulator n=1 Tax=Haloarchaeobius amylolyticus TaxID=1198296 RepID=UPI00226DE4A7|nr:helix-turn-helix domain-containing protein [Haloarchaeobius amylolyticus]
MDIDIEAIRAEAREQRANASASELEAIDRRVTELLDLLGKAHTMAILREFALGDDAYRFSELEDRLEVSPTTLSNRLGELTEAGLLTRRSYDEIPPRVEYRTTETADALDPMFEHLHRWAASHELE